MNIHDETDVPKGTVCCQIHGFPFYVQRHTVRNPSYKIGCEFFKRPDSVIDVELRAACTCQAQFVLRKEDSYQVEALIKPTYFVLVKNEEGETNSNPLPYSNSNPSKKESDIKDGTYVKQIADYLNE